MIQNILVGVVLVGAVVYISRIIYKSFQSNSSAACASGCGKCAESGEKSISISTKN